MRQDVGLHAARVMVRYLERSGIPKVSSPHVCHIARASGRVYGSMTLEPAAGRRRPARRHHRRADRDGRRRADDPDARVLLRRRPPDRDLQRPRRELRHEAGRPRSSTSAAGRSTSGWSSWLCLGSVPAAFLGAWFISLDAAGRGARRAPQAAPRPRAADRGRRPGSCRALFQMWQNSLPLGEGPVHDVPVPSSWSGRCRSSSSARSPGSSSASPRSGPGSIIIVALLLIYPATQGVVTGRHGPDPGDPARRRRRRSATSCSAASRWSSRRRC